MHPSTPTLDLFAPEELSPISDAETVLVSDDPEGPSRPVTRMITSRREAARQHRELARVDPNAGSCVSLIVPLEFVADVNLHRSGPVSGGLSSALRLLEFLIKVS